MAPEKAVPVLREIVELFKKEKPGPMLYGAFTHLTSNLEFINEIDEADKAYETWAGIVASDVGKESLDHAIVLVKWGMLLVNDARAEKAEGVLQKALPIIEIKDPGGPELIFTLQQLENVAVNQAKWKEAGELRDRYLDLVEKKYGRPSQELAVALANASHGLNQEEKHEECEKMARESVQYFESNRKEGILAAASAYRALGAALMGLRRWAEAEAAYQKAYAIGVKEYGKEDIRSTAAVNNLANSITQVADIQDDKERLEKAEAMFRTTSVWLKKPLAQRIPKWR